MIWIKRIAPLVVLVAGYFGYAYYASTRAESEQTLLDRHALVTAQVWVASAWYRNDPEAFISYRDSLLNDAKLSVGRMNAFLALLEDHPRQSSGFVTRVKYYVDSLSQEDQMPPREENEASVDTISDSL